MSTRSLVGVEHEYKWKLNTRKAEEDPLSYLSSEVFTKRLDQISRPVTVNQSTMHLDDESFSLAGAGHSLSCVINPGSLSSIAWICLKQTIRWERRRDCLEIAERVDPKSIPHLMNDDKVSPISHARRYGLITGRVSLVGVLTQTRYKRLAKLRGTDCGVTYGVDLVEFRSPRDGITPIGRYACLEMEVNTGDLEVMQRLDHLADEVTEWIGDTSEQSTKSQLATWAAHPDSRP